MKLSVIATLYLSEPHLEEFCERARAASEGYAPGDYEIILVNDGSPDASGIKARELCRRYPELMLVDLSRNFGHYRAVMTGLSFAKGDLVFLLDSDLEESPEWLFPFLEQRQRANCDVVFGVQQSRKGGWFERISGKIYWEIYSTITGLKIPKNQVTARLMTRRYVDALLLHKERILSMGVLFHLTGFDQRPMAVSKQALSETTYTFSHKIVTFVNSVVTVSTKPLIFIFFVGAAIFTIACVLSIYWIYSWMVKEPPPGWATLVISIWGLGGVTISSLGVIGLYLARIYEETKQRPYSIVREVFGSRASGETSAS